MGRQGQSGRRLPVSGNSELTAFYSENLAVTFRSYVRLSASQLRVLQP